MRARQIRQQARTWQYRYAFGDCERTRRMLQAKDAHRIDRGANEIDSLLCAAGGEIDVLAKKSVARMNRLGAAAPGSVDDRINIEVAQARGWGADTHRMIGLSNMQRSGVCV